MKPYTCLLVIIVLSIMITGQLMSQEPPRNKLLLRKEIVNPELKRGIELFKKQKYQEAEKIFLQVLNDEPRNLIAKEMLAGTYYHTQNVEQAKKYALLSLRQSRKSGYPFLVLAWVACTDGKMLAARDFVVKAERLAKTDLFKEEIKEFKKDYSGQFQTKTTPGVSTAVKIPAGDPQPYLAVFPFEDNTEQSEENAFAETISEMMVTALAQTNRYRLMERTQLDKVLDEQALGQSGALEQQTAVEVGKLIGVNVVLVGSVSKLDDRFELDARIIDAGSGEIRQAANSSVKDEEKLREAVNELAKKLTAD
jgi:TolB-like protein